MARKTANSSIPQASTIAERIEPIEAVHSHENPFSLDEHIDLFAVPIAHEVIKARLPERVEFHVRRLMTSDSEADRAELLQVLKAAKITIAVEVFHAVLSYAREARQLAASTDNNDRPTVGE